MGKASDNRRGYQRRRKGEERRAEEEGAQTLEEIAQLKREGELMGLVELTSRLKDLEQKTAEQEARLAQVEARLPQAKKPRKPRDPSAPRPKRPTTREIAREEAENVAGAWVGALAGQVRGAITFFTILLLGLAAIFGILYYIGERLQDLDFDLKITGVETKIISSELKSEFADRKLEAEIANLRGETRLQKEAFLQLYGQLDERINSLEGRVTSLEGQLTACEGSYSVESGDTVWEILKGKLGRNPTGAEIQTVVDANHLESYTAADGTWIVLIYPAQTLDLGEVVCG